MSGDCIVAGDLCAATNILLVTTDSLARLNSDGLIGWHSGR